MAKVILTAEGNKALDIPDQIASNDDQLKKALTPIYPDMANALIERKTAVGVLTVTVSKKAGTKGSALETEVSETVKVKARNFKESVFALMSAFLTQLNKEIDSCPVKTPHICTIEMESEGTIPEIGLKVRFRLVTGHIDDFPSSDPTQNFIDKMERYQGTGGDDA